MNLRKVNTAKRLLLLASIVLLVILGTGIYQLKYEVLRLENRLQEVNSQIDQEQENIRVLKAEWQYLTSPEMLSKVKASSLGLRKAIPPQIISLSDLAALENHPEDNHIIDNPEPALKHYIKARYEE